MTRGEIKIEILVRSGKDTTSAWTSEAFLNDWINQAHKWAAGYKPWPFTEGRVSTTYTTTEEWSFEGYKADSFRFIQVGGKRLQKINFEDYQIFKEEQSSSADKIFSDFGRLVYINTNAGLSGTLTAWGQYIPADIPDGDGATADDMETVFTYGGDEGNQAIIEKVLGYMANRDNKQKEAINNHALAKNILDELWKRIEDEQFAYHTKDRGQWERIDILNGRMYDDLKENQF
jgi:hypothetical protein